MYTYDCEVQRVIDGDTVVLIVDLGFHVKKEVTVRLLGLNAPEIRGAALTPDQRQKGEESKQHLKRLLSAYAPITCVTQKDRTGKYGRYLATLYGADEDGPVDLNLRLVADGHAVAT